MKYKQITQKKKTFIKGLAVNGVIQNESMKPTPSSPVSNPPLTLHSQTILNNIPQFLYNLSNSGTP